MDLRMGFGIGFGMGFGMGFNMRFGMGLTQDECKLLQVETKNKEMENK